MSSSSVPHASVLRQSPEKYAAIYARVSTADQADKGYSLPAQIDACQRLAHQEGYTVLDTHVFVDDYTGTSLNRPQFSPLRDLVRQRLVQAVFVYNLDRLSRKLAHQLLLSEEFEQAGVALRIVTMPDGPKTPETQLLSNVRGIIAEYERVKILERTARGRLARAKAGFIPSGRAPLGYVYVKHPMRGAHYEIHPEEAALVRRIFLLCAEGRRSLESIAALLTAEGIPTPGDRRPGRRSRAAVHVWQRSTISVIIRNTAYIGTLYDGKRQRIPGKRNPDYKTRLRALPREQWVPIAVPALIDTEFFEAAQRQLKTNQAQSKRNRKAEYLCIAGRLRCGQCGSAMTGEYVGTRRRYRCGRKRYQDVVAPHTRRIVAADQIEPTVWAAVERALNNPSLIATELERRRESTGTHRSDLERERQHYERQLTQCDKSLKRWEAAYAGEVIDLADFKAKKAEVDVRRVSAERELARLVEQQHLIEQVELETTSLMEYCERVRSHLQHFTLEEKQLVLEALGITLVWHPDTPLHICGSIPIEEIVSNAVRCDAPPQVAVCRWKHHRRLCPRG
jgi:site-specific DNA recombinase